jgi:anti-sigma factor ChrR (cupin superfamily)
MDDSGITTALFKLEPGAVVPLHEHTALEQTYDRGFARGSRG